MTDPALIRLANGVLWPGFGGTELPAWLVTAVSKGLGGVVYFASNLDQHDPDQPARLSKAIHQLNPDALIGVDEEGGLVTRLERVGGSSVPGNAVLGAVDDLELTQQTYAWLGALVARAGVDVDLAPDVDVNVNPANPVIGVRSFGAEPGLVARHTAAAVRGLQSQGVAACAKHFPGHGDTATDSHIGLATSDVSLDELRAVHLPPFESAIAAGAKAIMTAHIVVPALGKRPGTVNPAILGLARELGLTGMIVTDALDMAAIRATIGVGPGAVAALQAGADLLCVGNPGLAPAIGTSMGFDEFAYREVRDAIVAGLESGALRPNEVEAKIARRTAVAAWRRGFQVSQSAPTDPRGREIAARALQWSGRVRLADGPVLVVDARSGHSRAAEQTPDPFTAALRQCRQVDRLAVASLGDNAVARASVLAADHQGPVVVLVNQPNTTSAERQMVASVLDARPDVVIIQAGWPASGALTGDGNRVLSFGSSAASGQAVAQLLAGR